MKDTINKWGYLVVILLSILTLITTMNFIQHYIYNKKEIVIKDFKERIDIMYIDEFEKELNELEIKISEYADSVIDCMLKGDAEGEATYEKMYYDAIESKKELIENFNLEIKKGRKK